MARAIFKSWFVDFDPVVAKSEGRQPEGMDAEIAKLFPDSFVDSAIGRIPTGWEVCGLDGTADYLNGLALQKYSAEESEESIPAIKIAQLRVDHTLGSDRVNTRVPKDYIVQDGDVLFSWSGSLTVVLWCGGCGALNQHLFKVSSKRFQKWFYYLWTLQHLPEFQCIAADKATTMGHIQRHHLSAAKVLVPKPELLAHMDRVFDPIIQNIIRLKIESHTLSSLRDTLLPRLLSGDFDGIPDSNNMEAL
jgi:type I restriction enzyme S subunit